MNDASILPRHSSTTEEALAKISADHLPIQIRDVVNAEETPVNFVPFLAGHESVDLWFSDWSMSRKRQMVNEATELAKLKGTHEGVVRYLAYVDADVIDTVAYPARFVFGRSAIGITPIGHPPFKARYLVRVYLTKPVNAFVLGRSAVGMAALRQPDLEPIRRAKRALQVSKAPETEYLISFAWRRPATFGDALPFDGEAPFGGYVDRARL
ncbi:phage tail protein I [Pararhizobium haloflavum]|uniref:phage tail protein I n=1 Tax=Pararhizobium haloflavum TaxID=2037914 RepID=UPI000C183B5E|nr:phage tail protein I [Pararhizobium haloflavum]